MKQITDLTEIEADWVVSLLSALDSLGIPLDPASLDQFLDTTRLGRGDVTAHPAFIVNVVGAGVGEILATRLNLRWVSVTEERGTRLAVYGDSKKTLAFPLDAAARRWAGEPGSLEQYVARTAATIEQLRAGQSSRH